MPNVDINGTVVNFPDDLDEKSLNDAVSKAASQMGGQTAQPQGNYWKSAMIGGENVPPQTPLQNTDYNLRKGVGIGMKALNAPNELFGEPIRMAREALLGNPTSFRAPSVFQSPGSPPPAGFIQEVTGGVQGALRFPSALLQGQSPSQALQTASNEVTRPKDQPMDVVNQTAFALAAPEVAGLPYTAAGKVAGPILNAAKFAGKKLLSNITGPSPAAIDARLQNPELFKNAQDFPDLANKLPDQLNNLSDQISKAEGAAYNTLGTDPSMGGIPKNKISGLIDQIQKERGPAISEEEVSAEKALERLKDRINNKPGDVLSELDVKDMLKQMNKTINYHNPNAGATNDVLKSFKGQVNDLLTNQNDAYANAMQPVQQLTKLHSDILKSFPMRYEPGQGYVATDSTARALANLNGPYKSNAQNLLQQLDQATSGNLSKEAQVSKLAQQFQAKPILGSAGSRRTLAGTAIGGAVGKLTGSPALGAAVGAGTGALMDVEGGPIAGKILDAVSKIPEVSPEVLDAIRSALPGIVSASRQNQ